MIAALAHSAVGLLGLVLLYAALFLHETEEGQLQNRLEKLWVDIDDLSRTALSKQTAFLQRVSALANSALNKLFGVHLFSPGAVAASLCFSFASCILVNIAMVPLLRHRLNESEMYAFGVGIISTLIGLLRTPWRYLAFPWILFLLWGMSTSDEWPESRGEVSLRMSLVLIGGFLCDVLFIALSRWCLRKCSNMTNGWKLASLLILNGSIGLALISPLVLDIILFFKRIHRNEPISRLTLLASSNGVTGAISLFFILLALAALAHLLVWPLLERPLYSLQRFGLVRNPKLLAALSVTCLLFAWPHSPLILGITKLIHGG